jgi:hypothetical protein
MSFFVGVLKYRLNDDGTTVTVSRGSSVAIGPSVTIPANVTLNNNTYDVVAIEEDAFYGRVNLSSITIPASVLNIYDNAFSNCSNLESVTFLGSRPSIGSDAFLDIKDGAIGYYNPTIPVGSQEPWIAGESIDRLRMQPIPGSNPLDHPGSGSGSGGPTPTPQPPVPVPYTTPTLSFNGETTTITFGFTAIAGASEYKLFNSTDTNLTTSLIPTTSTSSPLTYTLDTPTVTTEMSFYIVGYNASNTAVTRIQDSSISVSISIPTDYTDLAGVTYKLNNGVNPRTATVVLHSESLATTTVTIPATIDPVGGLIYRVVKIGDQAFYSPTNLNITLSEGITSIGNSAFANSANLNITIPTSLTSFGENAFFGSSNLNITLPASFTSINSEVFANSTNLNITLSEGITSIGYSAFANYTGLTSITLPASLISIGDQAFEGCNNLNNIIFSAPSSLTSIGIGAFMELTNLTSITLPASLNLIGEGAFYNSGLTTVTFLGNKPDTIGDIAFLNDITGATLAYGYYDPIYDLAYSSATPANKRWTSGEKIGGSAGDSDNGLTMVGPIICNTTSSTISGENTTITFNFESHPAYSSYSLFDSNNTLLPTSMPTSSSLTYTLDTPTITTTKSFYIIGNKNNVAVNFSRSASISVVVGPPPVLATAPAKIISDSVTAVRSDTTVTLSWEEPNDGGSTIIGFGYEVRYSTISNSYDTTTPPSKTDTNQFVFTPPTQNDGITYYFQFRALNAVGSGEWSDEVTGASVAVPGAPTLVSLTPGNKEIHVRWEAPIESGGNATLTYNVYVKKNGDAGYTRKGTGIGSTFFIIQSLDNGATYYVYVTAIGNVDQRESAASDDLNATTFRSPILTAGTPELSDGTVKLNWTVNWNEGSVGSRAYSILGSNGGSPVIPIGATSCTVPDLTNGASYSFKLIAMTDVGISEITFDNLVPLLPPIAYEPPTLSFNENTTTITFGFTAIAGASEYKLFNSNNLTTQLNTTLLTSSSLTYQIDTPTELTEMSFYIIGYNGAGARVTREQDPSIDIRIDKHTANNGVTYIISSSGSGSGSINNAYAWDYIPSSPSPSTEITIPPTISISTTTYNVIAISASAFNGSSITKITLSNSVTSIGNYAFSNCAMLNNVTLSSSLTSIGIGAFSSCVVLEDITLPDSLTTISIGAFAGCNSLLRVTLPAGLTTINDNVFVSCTSLSSIEIPANLISIGYGAFNGCTNLNNITFPALSSLTTIGQTAFYGCNGLSSIEFPTGLTSIGDGAFFGCTGLLRVIFPNSPTTISIGDGAFYGCSFLMTVIFRGNKPTVVGSAFATANIGAKGYYIPGDTWSPSTITGLTMESVVDTAALDAAAAAGNPGALKTVIEAQLSNTNPEARRNLINIIKAANNASNAGDNSLKAALADVDFTQLSINGIELSVDESADILSTIPNDRKSSELTGKRLIPQAPIGNIYLPSTVSSVSTDIVPTPNPYFYGMKNDWYNLLLVGETPQSLPTGTILSQIRYDRDLRELYFRDSSTAIGYVKIEVNNPPNNSISIVRKDIPSGNTTTHTYPILAIGSTIPKTNTPPTITNDGTGTGGGGGGGGTGGGGLPCLPTGQRILTATGWRAVETLRHGDMIITDKGTAVPATIYSSTIKTTSETAPITIPANLFGRALPAAPVRLSPMHAVRMTKNIWEFPYNLLRSRDGVTQDAPGASVTYYHVALPNFLRDNMVLEGGVVAESYGAPYAKANGIQGMKMYTYNERLGGYTRIGEGSIRKTA